MFTVNFTKIYNRLLIITIAMQILINSTNTPWKDSILKNIQYVLWLFMVVLLIYFVQSRGITRRAVTGLCILFFYVMVSVILFKDKALVPLFIFGSYCIYIDDKQIVKDYMNGIIISVVIVVILSIMGYVPMKTDTNLLTIGFGNPNTLGFLLTIIYMGYCIVSKRSIIKQLLFAIILVWFNLIYLDDNTASIIIIIFYILQQVNSKQIIYFLEKLVVGMPEFFLLFSYFVTYTYGKYEWTYTLSAFLTGRPEIWAYYNNTYGIHLLPQHVQTYNLSSNEYFSFGKNLPLQYRGFDGAYIYLLIFKGVIVSFLILFAISYLIIQLDLKKEKVLVFSVLCILIFGITESIAVAPLGYFENFLLPLAIKKIILGNIKTEFTSKGKIMS